MAHTSAEETGSVFEADPGPATETIGAAETVEPAETAQAVQTAQSPETVPPPRTGEATPKPMGPRWRPAKPTLSAAGPWILAGALTVVYLVLALARYERMAPTSWDLGIFTEAVKQYAHFHAPVDDARAPGYEILGEHFSPIIAVLGPVFLIFPSAVTLLVAQSILFALGAVPLTRLGIDRIGPGAGYALGIAYGLSFGLAEALDADFHEIAFAVPLISFMLCAFIRERYAQAALWALPLLLVKEDLGITLVLPLGIAVILRGRTALGALLSAAGTAGSLLAVYWIIPSFSPTHTYEYWNKGGCADPTVVPHQPVTCLIGQTWQNSGGKIELVFLLLSITAFVALRSPLSILALPNLGSRFMTTNATFWGTTWHYNAILMPLLFVAAADGIIRARAAGPLPEAPHRLRVWGRAVSTAMHRHGAVAMLAVAFAYVPQYSYSQFFTPSTFTFDARTDALRHAMSLVPDGTSVETTINMLAPLSANHDAYWVGNQNPATDWVVFDQVVSGFSPAITDVVGFEQQRHPGAAYKIVYQDGYGIYVLHKVS
ncbi:MAG TPA: DUF2079 domain-containing protein [Actinocrinis sp.]|nr:DUF2079 domain-containing protein [Actinocrinis sp.]